MSDRYGPWIGKQRVTEALVTAYPADALNATLDRDDAMLREGDPVPPGWHLIYIREVVKLRATAEDGHPKKGDFLPPIDLPRRMWAGTKATYHKPFHIGERIRNITTIKSITLKEGKTGQLVFLNLENKIEGESGIATTEIQDVVYREEAKPGTTKSSDIPSASPEPVWKRIIHPSPVLLFRFSALTMNSHRIHYDRSYVTQVEKYPGLLVHGPLTFVLLLDLFRRELSKATLKTISVRAVSPLYDTHSFSVEGTPGENGNAELWALNHEGKLAMAANATFEV